MIPRGWQKCRVDEIGEVQGGRQRSPKAQGKLRPYLRVANVLDGYIDSSDVFEMPFTDREYQRFLLKDGDILVNEGQGIELVGRSAIYNGSPIGCCYQNTLIRFRPGPKVDGRFVQELFKYHQVRGGFQSIASRTTSIAHLGVERFASFVVSIPPLGQQQEIARVLNIWQRAIDLTEQDRAAKQARRSWLMQQLLMGIRRFPQFGQAWRKVRIGDLLEEVSRPVSWDDKRLCLGSA